MLIWKGNEYSCNFTVGPLCPSLRRFRADWQQASRVDRVLWETDWGLSPTAPVQASPHGWSLQGPWGPAQAGWPPPAPGCPLHVSTRRSCLTMHRSIFQLYLLRSSAVLRQGALFRICCSFLQRPVRCSCFIEISKTQWFYALSKEASSLVSSPI